MTQGLVIVTGGSRGIGAAVCRRLAQDGYAVAVNYAARPEAAAGVVQEITAAGGQAGAFAGDVSREAEVEALFAAAQDRFGRLAGLVNNAGITGGTARLDELTLDVLHRTLAVNVVGTVLASRAAVRAMSTRHGGAGHPLGHQGYPPARRGGGGGTYLPAGMGEQARAEARRTMAALAGPLPVVGLEPSCLLTLRDEFASLLPGSDAKALSARAVLLSEFLAREGVRLPLRAQPGRAHVHGHCHQKSFGAFPDALSALRQVPSLDVQPITSSCCGMAGAFGYQAETQEASAAMAEAGLLPAVRAAGAADRIVADGTSCRHQIADLTGRRAVHSVVLLDEALG